MRRWNYGINSLYRTGHYTLEQAPAWVFFLERIATMVCDFIPPIPPPPIRMLDQDGQPTTWRENYGDLRQFFHLAVHTPLDNWLQPRIECQHLPASYEELRKRFYARDRRYWDEEEALGDELRTEAAKESA